ncbi:hypothetical protein SAMN04488579_10137 [Eubacterium barkeri]|uniref:Uncharacterized protein n=1 Tax=Eubacterium barkeri TaxID=1528 RepID=A0A1H3AGG8_EUBBA|nr:hypothetical protein SAMN04488579_10137 [Eubacterium barkeri]
MNLFNGLKRLFSGTQYRINRDILLQYMNEDISFSKQENLCFCDEFFLSPNEADEKLHIVIINYDAPCKTPLESEEGLTGVIIFVCKGKKYNPEIDQKYYTIEDFITYKLANYPEWFTMVNELVQPTSLANYKL